MFTSTPVVLPCMHVATVLTHYAQYCLHACSTMCLIAPKILVPCILMILDLINPLLLLLTTPLSHQRRFIWKERKID